MITWLRPLFCIVPLLKEAAIASRRKEKKGRGPFNETTCSESGPAANSA
jgi:hypothetical protein